MVYRFTTIINKERKWYVARCAELGVVSQGKTVEEAQSNLREAVELYLEGRPSFKKLLRCLGLKPHGGLGNQSAFSFTKGFC